MMGTVLLCISCVFHVFFNVFLRKNEDDVGSFPTYVKSSFSQTVEAKLIMKPYELFFAKQGFPAFVFL